MRAYYTVTNAGRDCIQYRARLHELWNHTRPDLPMDPHQLSDQVRSILRRNALSRAELEQLKVEVGTQMNKEPTDPIEPVIPMTPPRRRSTIYQLTRNEHIYMQQKKNVELVNSYVAVKITESVSLLETSHLVYCAATTVAILLDLPVRPFTHCQDLKPDQEPPWRKRLLKTINKIRTDISYIHIYLTTRNPSKNV
ncbi:hypothetical protein HHI36_018473 [Cryptolaemus montrouzieri]|uniref:Uncharacterized protein n=1 Tax=Cryptolaemus montrouzieri TaxID=559131 RepID=A0ABD2P1A6_9CUCU